MKYRIAMIWVKFQQDNRQVQHFQPKKISVTPLNKYVIMTILWYVNVILVTFLATVIHPKSD